MRLPLRQTATLILISGLFLINVNLAKADHNHVPKKTLLILNTKDGKRILKGSAANEGLKWIAKHAFKPTTSAGLYYRGNVYQRKVRILAVARRYFSHRWPVYRYRGKIAPQAFSAAVTKYFKGYAYQAVRVSFCESGWRTWAKNGQYLGTFQMGSYARAKYGHGYSYDAQARSASRYFFAAGADWSPWECQPY